MDSIDLTLVATEELILQFMKISTELTNRKINLTNYLTPRHK